MEMMIMEEEKIPELLEIFLDTASSVDKLNLIQRHRGEIDERMVSNMEASLDLIGKPGTVDDRLDYIEYYLRTRSRFETNRFR